MRRAFNLLFAVQLVMLASAAFYFADIDLNNELHRSRLITIFLPVAGLCWIVEFTRRKSGAMGVFASALMNFAAAALGLVAAVIDKYL